MPALKEHPTSSAGTFCSFSPTTNNPALNQADPTSSSNISALNQADPTTTKKRRTPLPIAPSERIGGNRFATIEDARLYESIKRDEQLRKLTDFEQSKLPLTLTSPTKVREAVRPPSIVRDS